MGLPQGKRLFVCHVHLAIAGLLVIVHWLASQNQASAQEIKKETPKLDSYGDPLPDGAIARLGTIRLRHGELIEDLAFARDGRSLLSAGYDGAVRRWELPSGKLLSVSRPRSFTDSFGRSFLKSFTFLDHGARVATVNPDGLLEVLDTTDLKQKLLINWKPTLPRHAAYAFSPSCDLLAYANSRGVVVLETQTGKTVCDLHTGIRGLAFSSDGRFLTTTGERMQVWDVRSGEKVKEFAENQHGFTLLCQSPAKEMFVSLAFQGPAQVWDGPTGKELFRIPFQTKLGRFSNNGEILAVSSYEGPVRLFNTSTWKEIDSIPNSSFPSHYVFSRDDRYLAIASGPSIRVWDLKQKKDVTASCDNSRGIPYLAFSPNGRLLATRQSFSSAVTLWDCETWKSRRLGAGESTRYGAVCFSARGDALIESTDDSVAGWSIDEGRLLFKRNIGRRMACISVSEDGRWLIGGDFNGLKLIDLARESPARFVNTTNPHTPMFTCDECMFARNGKAFFVWGQTAYLKLYALESGDEILCLTHALREGRPFNPIKAIGMFPNERFLVSGDNEGLHFWDLMSRRALKKIPMRYFHHFDLSPNGRLMAIVNEKNEIPLWEAKTGLLLATLTGEQAHCHVKFSPDGMRLASYSYDSTVLVWSVFATEPKRDGHSKDADLGASWNALGTNDGKRVYAAMTKLIEAGGKAVSFLKGKRLSAPCPSPSMVAKLIADLDHNDFKRRDEAFLALKALGNVAESEIKAAAKQPASAEAARRLELLLKELPRWDRSTDELRALRAITVLEAIKSQEAIEIIKGLASGDPRLEITSECGLALERLHKRR